MVDYVAWIDRVLEERGKGEGGQPDQNYGIIGLCWFAVGDQSDEVHEQRRR